MIGTLSTTKMLLKGSPTNGVGLEQTGTCAGWGLGKDVKTQHGLEQVRNWFFSALITYDNSLALCQG
ncbi:hypothetical protein SLA2020_355420 [Shorea laevis]